MKPETVDLRESLVELVRKASTELPDEVVSALKEFTSREEKGSAAEGALLTILENIELASKTATPICQDTGAPIFHVHYPFGYSTRDITEQIQYSIIKSTEASILRPNAVDSISGKNSGNNIGKGLPSIYFDEWDEDSIKIDLLLKGGGSENVGAQYKLPDSGLKAGRDLNGVRRVVLDAVYNAQGKGCAPGILGVGIGGDRGTSYLCSKKQLFRSLKDRNPNPKLADIEEQLLEEANRLDIGPMGFGGRTTVIGVKIGDLHRLPACFFVTISYLCWAARKASLTYRAGEVKIDQA